MAMWCVASIAALTPTLDPRLAAAAAHFLNDGLAPAERRRWVLASSDVGAKVKAKNFWSRGLWRVEEARVNTVDAEGLSLEVTVVERGRKEPLQLHTRLPFARNCETADQLRAELLHINLDGGAGDASSLAGDANLVDALRTSGTLLSLPGASDRYSLPCDLWLNTTPLARGVRRMFYEDVTAAVVKSVLDKRVPRRMKVVCSPPELNTQMDTYRVGTLLELVRSVGLGCHRQGLKIRICVQASMGEGAFTGTPRVLSGVNKLLLMMDWQAMPGEENEGAIVYPKEPVDPLRRGDEKPGEVQEGSIRFGAVGASEVKADDDLLFVLLPQNMVGASIFGPLAEMADACEQAGAALILLNPDLDDRPSSGGLMGVRGRQARVDFAASFSEIYHFRLLYSGTTFMYPIRGAVRMSRAADKVDPPTASEASQREGGTAQAIASEVGTTNGQSEPGEVAHTTDPLYVLYRRDEDPRTKSEVYTPLAASLDCDFSPSLITELLVGRADDEPRPPSPTDRLKL